MRKIKSSEITRAYLSLPAGFSQRVWASLGVQPLYWPPARDRTLQQRSFPASEDDAAMDGATPTAGNGTDELGEPLQQFRRHHQLQQLLRVHHRQSPRGRIGRRLPHLPLGGDGGRVWSTTPKPTPSTICGNFEIEERIYRLRCVEAWSMVIPWMGFPLSKLLQEVEPKAEAKYVRFETIYDPDGMPGVKTNPWYDWPYVEGLRVDEAMNDLTLLATGLYGKDLLPQNGAPIRLVVPWKYGFKSIKSIVKIDLVEEMPVSLWMAAAPNEYGFYANVNPEVDHPRWSQAANAASANLAGAETLMFNGYEEEVAHLYAGMDLARSFNRNLMLAASA